MLTGLTCIKMAFVQHKEGAGGGAILKQTLVYC